MVSQKKNLTIIESLVDQRRTPAYLKDKVVSLGEITIYTGEAEEPLYKVLNSIKAKENGQKVTLDLSKATPDELRAYMVEILPAFDRERVYPTDIKRLLNWYNLLLDVGITEFDPRSEEAETTEPEEADVKEESQKASTKSSVVKNVTVPKKNVTATKPSAGKSAQRTRQK